MSNLVQYIEELKKDASGVDDELPEEKLNARMNKKQQLNMRVAMVVHFALDLVAEKTGRSKTQVAAEIISAAVMDVAEAVQGEPVEMRQLARYFDELESGARV